MIDPDDPDRNGKIVNDFVPKWDTNHNGYRSIFNAALTGICANPAFFGQTMQGDPRAAVEFANEVTLAAIYGDKYVPVHERQKP
jgi:hypothetical protein